MSKKQVSISTELFNLLSIRIQNPQIGFSTVDDYIEYVLTELFNEDKGVSEEEAKQIRDELKKLGYV
jgi:hypothetical protein